MNVRPDLSIYAYLSAEEKAYDDFLDRLAYSCSLRAKIGPQAPKIGAIYATKILRKRIEFWTRAQIRWVFDRRWVYADLIDVGEINLPVAIKNLVFIPDYLALDECHLIKRFYFAGCQSVTLEDFKGKSLFFLDFCFDSSCRKHVASKMTVKKMILF